MTENNRKEYQRKYYLKNKNKLLNKNKEYYYKNKNKYICNNQEPICNLRVKRGNITVSFD